MTTTTYKRRTRYQTTASGEFRQALDIHSNFGSAVHGEPDDLTQGVYLQFGTVCGAFSAEQAREAAAALNALADEIEADVQRKEAERIPEEPYKETAAMVIVQFPAKVPATRTTTHGKWHYINHPETGYTWSQLCEQVRLTNWIERDNPLDFKVLYSL